MLPAHSRKRRHPESESPDDVVDVDHSMKRRRQQPIESGFAALSLSPFVPKPPFLQTEHGPLLGVGRSHPANEGHITTSLPSVPSAILPLISTQPTIVAERELSSPEVRMASSSWYEPEKDRIVVLDLDSASDTDEDLAADHSSTINMDSDEPPMLTLSPAVLAVLKNMPSSRSGSSGAPPASVGGGAAGDAGKALVLFTPPKWPLAHGPEPGPGVTIKLGGTNEKSKATRVRHEIETIHAPPPRSTSPIDSGDMDLDP